MKRLELCGMRFGHLVVIEDAGQDSYGNRLVRCTCDCGNEVICRPATLKTGHQKSCGCSRKRLPEDNRRGTRIYRIWVAMRQRCYNQVSSSYKWYGALGVRVCEEWKEDFDAFKKWALENGYQEDLSIDRINVNGDYEPRNCRWVNMTIQNNNKRQKL